MIAQLIIAAAVWAFPPNGFSQTSQPETAAVPRFETGDCVVPIPKSVTAVCGKLVVRESRKRAGSNVIRLPVVIIKSTSPKPAPDPIVYTAGGPGAGTLRSVRGAANLAPILSERDYIFFEQRGTAQAEPSLACPEVDEALHDARLQNLDSSSARRLEVSAAGKCRVRLKQLGVDLSAYNSAASAADLEDLRRALGIRTWNLFGISYSTRLMLNYVRDYGEHVRSVVLDSVLPPSVNWDEGDVDRIMDSLDKIIARCESDAKCAASHPRIKTRFIEFLRRANKTPLTIEVASGDRKLPVSIDGNDIFDLVYNLLENNYALDEILLKIEKLVGGDTSPVSPYAENLISGSGFIWGMRYSVWCSEEMPFQRRSRIGAQANKYDFIRGFKVQGSLPEICDVWKVERAESRENTPVRNRNVPLLIFGGRYDPDTPPEWGKLVSTWFTKSYFYEIPNSTHGANNNGCTFARITTSFVRAPTIRPDDACVKLIPELQIK